MDKVYISNIRTPTYEYICGTYGVSRVTAWRLLSGRQPYICVGYHEKQIYQDTDAWGTILDPNTMKYVRNIMLTSFVCGEYIYPATSMILHRSAIFGCTTNPAYGLQCRRKRKKHMLPRLQSGQRTMS